MADWDYGFLYVLALSVIEIYGDFSLRFYAQTDKLFWLGNGILGYIGVIWMLIQSFKFKNVLYVNGMWDGLSGITESIASYVILGDRLEHPIEYIGLLFIIVGVALMKGSGGIGA